jgi:hypothetical protein
MNDRCFSTSGVARMHRGQLLGVIRVNHRYGENKCSVCGVELDLPLDAKPRTMIAGASGKPNMHVISVDGKEIHRCEVHSQMGQEDDDGDVGSAAQAS